jgi:hypothetical protein
MHRWFWKAVFNDDSSVRQGEVNPSTGREWSSDDLDLDRLVAIVMEPVQVGQPRVLMQVRSGEKPKRFWRQYLPANGPMAGKRSTCWALALEKDGTTFCVYFRPDGSIVLSTDFQNGSEFQVGA